MRYGVMGFSFFFFFRVRQMVMGFREFLWDCFYALLRLGSFIFYVGIGRRPS
jgi:hypothetical protein